jgi:predicted nucleic acid-binding protein
MVSIFGSVLRAKYRYVSPSCQASPSVPVDASATAIHTLRRKQLTFENMREIQREAEALLLGNEHEVDSQRVLELVRDSDCSACGCEFVSVAMRLGIKLLTADKKVLKSFPEQTVALSAA